MAEIEDVTGLARTKEIIRDLYVAQGWRLEDVRDHLEANHGFVRSKSWFAAKLKEWGFKKHLKGPAPADFRIASYKVAKARKMGKKVNLYFNDKHITPRVLRGARFFLSHLQEIELDRQNPPPRTPPGFRLVSASRPVSTMQLCPRADVSSPIECQEPTSPASSVALVRKPSQTSLPGPIAPNSPVIQPPASPMQLVFDAFINSPPPTAPKSLPVLDLFERLQAFDISSQTAITLQVEIPWSTITSPRIQDLVSSSVGSLILGESGLNRRQMNAEQFLTVVVYLVSNNLLDTDSKHSLFETINRYSLWSFLGSNAMRDQRSAKAVLESFFPVAMQVEDIAVVRQLLEMGVNPNGIKCQWTSHPVSPFHFACLKANYELGRILIDKMSSLDGPDSAWTRSAIVLAIIGSWISRTVVMDIDEEESQARDNRLNELLRFLEALLQAGAKVNLPSQDDIKFFANYNYGGELGAGHSPLTIASRYQLHDAVQLMLRNGADVRFVTKSGTTCLQEALLHSVMDHELTSSAYRNMNGETMIRHRALRPFPDRIVKELLQAGADPNVPPPRSPAEVAVSLDDSTLMLEAVELLLKHGMRPTTMAINILRSRNEFNLCSRLISSDPEHIFASRDYWVFLGRLGPNDAPWLAECLNKIDYFPHRQHFLMDILKTCGPDTVQEILEEGEFDSCIPQDGDQLIAAILKLSPEALMRVKGPSLCSFLQTLPGEMIHSAIINSNVAMAELLIKSGVEVNVVIPEARTGPISHPIETAVCAAIRLNERSIFDVLLEAGAKLHIPTTSRHCRHETSINALVVAAAHGNLHMAQELISRGADINSSGQLYRHNQSIFRPEWETLNLVPATCSCLTPLSAAISSENWDIVELLIGVGAQPHCVGSLKESKLYCSPLCLVLCYQGGLSWVETLLDRGANPCDARAIAIVSRSNQGREILKLLLTKAGAGIAQDTDAIVAALFQATRFGDEALVKMLLPMAGLFNIPDHVYYLFLCTAMGKDPFLHEGKYPGADCQVDERTRIVQLLVQALNTPHRMRTKPDGKEICPFSVAADLGRIDILQQLFISGFRTPPSGETCLLSMAVTLGRVDLLEQLLQSCVQPQASNTRCPYVPCIQNLNRIRKRLDEMDETSFHRDYLLDEGQLYLKAMDLLFQSQIWPGRQETSIKTKKGSPEIFASGALQLAAYYGHLDLVELLVSKGADVNEPGTEHKGATALQIAIWQDSFEIGDFLVSAGANPDGPRSSAFEMTALESAAARGSVKWIRLLVENGADAARVTESHGVYSSPLNEAVNVGQLDAVQYLVQHGAEIDNTAIRWAASQHSTEVFNFLVYHRLRQKDQDRGFLDAALRFACWAGHLALAERLIEHGADINAAPVEYEWLGNSAGRNALENGAAMGRIDIVQLLFNYGVRIDGSARRSVENAAASAEANGHHAVSGLIKEKLEEERRNRELWGCNTGWS